MAYLTKKEEETLLDIEQYIFTLLNFKRETFESTDEFMKVWSDYQKLWKLNDRLIQDREKMNAFSREGMRKYRSENPEKAKEYARQYMRQYNRKKRS